MTTSNLNDAFYLSQEEPNRGCYLALRSIILKFDKRLTETKKYGMPCFCYEEKAFCYLWKDKKNNEPYILMVDGNLLKHAMLEKGDRARMKVLPIDPNQDLNLDTIGEVLKEGINLRLV